MKMLWSDLAQSDLGRLHAFLAARDPEAAGRVLDTLIEAPETLLGFPRRGTKLAGFDPREVREFRAGRYLLRYELANLELRVLRIFHAREDRISGA